MEEVIPYGYIYETTNDITGRKYIGKHKSSSFDEDYLGSGKILRQAFEKYCRINFTVRLLFFCYSKEELDAEEKFVIDHYNAVESKGYYNIAKGGDGGDVTGGDHEGHSRKTKEGMAKMSPEAKLNMIRACHSKRSESHLSALRKGSSKSWENPERRRRFHEAMKGNTYASHPQSTEHKAKASEFQLVYQNTYEAKLKIAEGRGREMLKEFIRLNLSYNTPSDWDSNRYLINYGRKYQSSYFLKYFNDWTSFINTIKS